MVGDLNELTQESSGSCHANVKVQSREVQAFTE